MLPEKEVSKGTVEIGLYGDSFGRWCPHLPNDNAARPVRIDVVVRIMRNSVPGFKNNGLRLWKR